ncbi:nitroreductase/quinone reductase family protein [Streptomyces sp. NPDC058657]|uniref:nitroreductase/quinone reductase family protein n=1 Tax=unclassified Streptomyces TaxID=2593676 RepID=UPI0036646485
MNTSSTHTSGSSTGDGQTVTAHPNPFNQSVIDEFRANGGRVGGPFEGGDLLLLTTTGAKSGKRTTNPLGYVRRGEHLMVVGSAGGADRHPAWYHNLLARPTVTVEIGTEEYEAVAVPAEGARRDELFAYIADVERGYADYQRGTTRTLPVVLLERVDHFPESGPIVVRTMADKILEIHTWLRGQLRHVQAEAAAHFAAQQEPGAPTLPGLGLQIRQHCLAFCETLDFHHRSEDAGVFPGIAHYHPELADALARMSEEHKEMSRLKGELVALLADHAHADQVHFMAELDRMAEGLTAHLDYEEEWLLPVLAEVPMPGQ